MKLTLNDAALAKIQPMLDDHTVVLLSYDDGVGPYSHHGLTALIVAFKVILIRDDMNYKDYDTPIDSNIGKIYVKGYSTKLLGEDMQLKLETTFNNLELSSESEMIDEDVELDDLRKDDNA